MYNVCKIKFILNFRLLYLLLVGRVVGFSVESPQHLPQL